MLVAIGHVPREATHAGEPWLCAYVVSAGGAAGGCNLLADPFSVAPFWLSESIAEGGDQYATLSGLASDDVARLELFLATGESRPILLRDNAWAIRAARADRPYRVVAYDREGRIIGIQDIGDEDARLPRLAGAWRTVLAAHDSQGRVAEVRVAPSSDGGRCFDIRLPGGAGSGGCPPKASLVEMPTLALGVDLGRNAAWLTGQVADEIASIDVMLDDGRVETVTPTEGFVLVPLPAGPPPDRSPPVHYPIEKVVGRDASGREVAVYRPGRTP